MWVFMESFVEDAFLLEYIYNSIFSSRNNLVYTLIILD